MDPGKKKLLMHRRFPRFLAVFEDTPMRARTVRRHRERPEGFHSVDFPAGRLQSTSSSGYLVIIVRGQTMLGLQKFFFFFSFLLVSFSLFFLDFRVGMHGAVLLVLASMLDGNTMDGFMSAISRETK